MPWIEKKHYYKDFMDSIMNAVQTIPHEKVVWFGVHRRMGLIRDYLAALGVNLEYVIDNNSAKQGINIKREWCMPLRKSYVQLDDRAIDKIVVNKELVDLSVVSAELFSEQASSISNTLFFTAIEDFESVKEQLLEMGASEEKIIKLPSEAVLWRETCEYFDSVFVNKKTKDLPEHKATIIKILQEFSDFCEKEGLRYYLAYGTLIGAVRHSGIIPWDDDIDVIMPIEDYNKFLQLYPQNRRYKVLNHNVNDDYIFPFAKLVDDESKLHHVECPITWYQGEYIDIFPVSGYPKEIEAEKWWDKIYLLDVEWYWYYIARDIVPNLEDPRERIQKERFKYPCDDGNDVGVMMTLPPKPWKAKSDFWLNEMYMKFEGEEYRVPEEYDNHLKSIYGDYMKLPPMEEREVHGFPTYY